MIYCIILYVLISIPALVTHNIILYISITDYIRAMPVVAV